MKSFNYSILIASVFASCGNGDEKPDAYGNFIATEITISAESAGKILVKSNSEGDIIDQGRTVFVIDTVQTYLKKSELLARRQGVAARRKNIKAQLAVIDEQRRALRIDVNRFKKMYNEGAASEKQLNDLENKLTVLDKQMQQVETNFAALDAENKAINASLSQVEDLLERSKVKSPCQGTILETYAEIGESVAPGKPLFKMADLTTMELKAYFSGNQLAKMRMSDTVEVFTDNGQGELSGHVGIITWIATDAEFTPKIIQTREERVNLVYAVKISVKNDGSLKINMPGEVRLLN